MKDLQFPENFWWGAAASAPQTEGSDAGDGKSPSTWDQWFELEPERFDQNIGPQVTSNVYHLYHEDVQRMKKIGFNSYRTSIAWTRLLPDGKTLNNKAVLFYRDYFTSLKKAGIEPVVNLFHFDMPWWQMEKGGWLDDAVSDRFAHYAQIAVREFGDLVKYWHTFNEPIVHVEMSYLYGHHYPAENNLNKAVLAAYHTILAHAKAVKAMRNENKEIQIGTILNLTPIYARSQSDADQKAARAADLLRTRSFLDAMVQGTFSKELLDLLKENNLMIETRKDDLDLISEVKLDFLGVNYYQPYRVQAPSEANQPAQTLEDLFESYVWPERRMNPYRGWEIYPEALYDIAVLIQQEYDNIPWYVSENGMGVADEMRFANQEGIVQDDYRIEFIQQHLEQVHKAIKNGSNCFGYHLWTFVDCWSWLNGYRNRYGLYRVDLKTQKRYPKKSAYWMKEFIEKQAKEVK